MNSFMQNTELVNNAQSFEREFNELMTGYKTPDYWVAEPQWKSPNDFFVKFSLYTENNGGITSINTSNNPNR